MTIEPLENGVYLSFGGNGLYYSIDDSEWVSLPIHTNTPSINVGQTIKIKGLNVKTDTITSYFTINGRCKLSGTIMSILYGDKPYEEKLPFNSCFIGAFYNCTSIVAVASDFLPATTLASGCYSHMFWGCSSLTTAPELPATTLASDCYSHMFSGCSSLTTAPELPATTLADYCYSHMFWGCSRLNYIKMLATDISAYDCLYGWVGNVSSTGAFMKNPAMTTLPTGSSGIPEGWTVVNDGEESGGDKIVNHGHIGKSTGYYIEWEYPVSSLISVVFNTYSPVIGDSTYELPTGINASKSGYPITFAPGESLASLRSITPIEDSTYIYEIIIEE